MLPICNVAPVYADQSLGTINLVDGESIEDRIEQLMQRLVRPQTYSIRQHSVARAPKENKLNATLRGWLKTANIYSRNVSDLSKHRVVPNYPIAAANDLYAEFALKNGVIHIIETLDFKGHDKMTAMVHKEAAMKSIVLDQAKRNLDPASKKIAVIDASDYNAMRPAIGIVNNYADDVIAMSSNSDKQRLVNFIAGALHVQSTLPMFP